MFFALALQGCVVLAVAVIGVFWHGGAAGLALAYGGAAAWVNAGLLCWRWRSGLHVYHCDGQRHLRSFHRSMLERFAVVVMLLGLGLGFFDLAPKLLLLGFVVGQLAWIIATFALRTFDAPWVNQKS